VVAWVSVPVPFSARRAILHLHLLRQCVARTSRTRTVYGTELQSRSTSHPKPGGQRLNCWMHPNRKPSDNRRLNDLRGTGERQISRQRSFNGSPLPIPRNATWGRPTTPYRLVSHRACLKRGIAGTGFKAPYEMRVCTRFRAKLHFFYGRNGRERRRCQRRPISTSAWTYVTATYMDGATSAYINGASTRTTAASFTPPGLAPFIRTLFDSNDRRASAISMGPLTKPGLLIHRPQIGFLTEFRTRALLTSQRGGSQTNNTA